MFYLLAIVRLKSLSVFYLQDDVQVELCELSNVKFLIGSKIIEVKVLRSDHLMKHCSHE